jgi:hypothetical protein
MKKVTDYLLLTFDITYDEISIERYNMDSDNP